MDVTTLGTIHFECGGIGRRLRLKLKEFLLVSVHDPKIGHRSDPIESKRAPKGAPKLKSISFV
jgi:hypothetical protein